MNKLSQFFSHLKLPILGMLSPLWKKIKGKFNKLRKKIQASKYKNWTLASISVFSIAIILGGGYLLTKTSLFQKLLKPPVVNPWTPYKPSPAPLAHGKQTYKIQGGGKNLPQITEVTLNPIDPLPNSTQTIYVKANNETPISKVSVMLHLDNETETTKNLQLNSGNKTNGEWSASWSLNKNETYDYTYRITVIARNEKGLGSPITISLR